MLREERHKYIIETLNESGIIKISDLTGKLNVAEMTLRRDIKYLEEQGLLTRIHGGALSKDSKVFKELTPNEKREMNIDKKIEVARLAASLIEKDDVVYIGPGTTNEYIYDYIKVTGVKVITNCLNIFEKFKDDDAFELILIGGKLRKKTNTLVGSLTNDFLSNLRVKTAFIGANGVFNNDIMTSNEDEGTCQKTIMNRAIRRYLLCDSSKIEKEDFFTLYKLEDITAMITNAELDEDLYKKYSRYCNIITNKKEE